MKQLDAGGRAILRADQRNYESNTASGSERVLNGASPEPTAKRDPTLIEGEYFGRGAAVSHMLERMKRRLENLRTLNPRRGFDGVWRNEAGRIVIEQRQSELTLGVDTVQFSRASDNCQATGKGRVANGVLKIDLDDENVVLGLCWKVKLHRSSDGLMIEAFNPAGAQSVPRYRWSICKVLPAHGHDRRSRLSAWECQWNVNPFLSTR